MGPSIHPAPDRALCVDFLGLITGSRSLSDLFLGHLVELIKLAKIAEAGGSKHPDPNFEWLVSKLEEDSEIAAKDRLAALRVWLSQDEVESFRRLPLSTLNAWAPRVVRHSLRTGQALA